MSTRFLRCGFRRPTVGQGPIEIALVCEAEPLAIARDGGSGTDAETLAQRLEELRQRTASVVEPLAAEWLALERERERLSS